MTRTSSQVWVFFYGTFMNPQVLREFGVTPLQVAPAALAGFKLSVCPRPNVATADGACVFGSLMQVTQENLASIYGMLEQRFALKYLPEAVMVQTLEGWSRPALCYIVPNMTEASPEAQFIRQLADCVRTMQLPESYAAYIESLAPPGGK